jgi:hypothetical protein
MHPSIKKILFFAVALTTLLSACIPAQQSTPSASDIANQVATAVALTVEAQNSIETHVAETVVSMATNTVLPTQTEAVPVPLTETPTAVVLPTATKASSGGGGGGGTTVKPDYACNPFPRKPRDNTIFRPNDEFDISWTIVNTGKKTMQAGIDVRYNSGTKLTSTSYVELPELEPGEQYVVDFDAQAPAKEGTYIMTFKVEGGLCYPYTAIIVEKP